LEYVVENSNQVKPAKAQERASKKHIVKFKHLIGGVWSTKSGVVSGCCVF